MVEVPVTGALAEYHGRRFPIVFSGDDWVALRAERGVDIPDGFAIGESSVGLGQNKPWVKVPRSISMVWFIVASAERLRDMSCRCVGNCQTVGLRWSLLVLPPWPVNSDWTATSTWGGPD